MRALVSFILLCMVSCVEERSHIRSAESANGFVEAPLSGMRQRISDAAISITNDEVVYDPSYFTISYPRGDVPANKGVCTDVVIRTFRKINIDLQKLVHEDMKKHWEQYPKLWGLPAPDRNIDHRRVPNLMKFFSRHGEVRKGDTNASAYLPGDIVAWRLQNGRTHIGIVVNKTSGDGKRKMMVHNIGAGQVVEDCLFNFDVIGHYYFDSTFLTTR